MEYLVWEFGVFFFGILLHFAFCLFYISEVQKWGFLCIYPFYLLYLYHFIAKHLHGAVGVLYWGWPWGEIRLILACGLSFFSLKNIYAYYLVPT